MTERGPDDPLLSPEEQRENLRRVGWIFVVLFTLLGLQTWWLLENGTAEDLDRASRYATDPNNGALAP